MDKPEGRLHDFSVDSFTATQGSAHSEDNQESKTPPSTNSVLAALSAGLGSILFGYSLGFTSPCLTAMEILDEDSVFVDSSLEKVRSLSWRCLSRPCSSYSFGVSSVTWAHGMLVAFNP